MKIYYYNEFSKEYIGEGVAVEDPIDPGNWLLPGNAVAVRPPAYGSGHSSVWDGMAWQVVDDYRDVTVYSTSTGIPSKITELGPIPRGYTRLKPSDSNKTWNGSSWVDKQLDITEIKKSVQIHLDAVAKKMGYNSILDAVSYADEPSVSRYQQDGIRLRKWRSDVWQYVSKLIDNMDELPTIKQLINKLPKVD